MNKFKTITIIGVLFAVLSLIFFLKSNNKNEEFHKEVLEVIISNKKEYEKLAIDILELNQFINRNELRIEGQIPNEISIDIKEYGISNSVIGTRIGLPENNHESEIYRKIYILDSINYSTIKSIKRYARNLEFYNIKMDTLDVLTFELLKCYSPIECNVYNLVYNSNLKSDNSYFPISSKLYFKTASTYFQ